MQVDSRFTEAWQRTEEQTKKGTKTSEDLEAE
jgi:hypothetical protein